MAVAPIMPSRDLAATADFYSSLGFEQTEPYYGLPAELREWLVYFRTSL